MSLWVFMGTVVGVILGQTGVPRVAVVHVPVVSDKYVRTHDLEAQFDQKRIAFNQQRDEIKQKIERLNQSLQEELKPGSPEYQERARQVLLLETELKFFVESEGQKIEQGLAGSLRSIYNDIHAAIKAVADEKGIDIVLAADAVPPDPPTSTQQARQQIVLQKVLYWTTRADITEEVITRLNAEYKPQPLTLEGALQPPKGGEAQGKPPASPAPKNGAKP
jgi:Skp family chaperone for outer membrane proteins